MEREGEIIGGVDFSSDERTAEKVEIDRGEIISQIKELSSQCGMNISEYEFDIALHGPKKGDQESQEIYSRICELPARLEYKATDKDSPSPDSDRRDYGAQSLLWRALSYLKDAPEYSELCVEKARQVIKEEIVFDGSIVPDADKEMIQKDLDREREARERKEYEERKKAA